MIPLWQQQKARRLLSHRSTVDSSSLLKDTKDDEVLGGYWCFPGGKVEIGETVADTIARERAEETGLNVTDNAFFVDSYLLGDRFSLHFAVEVQDNHVSLNDDLQAYAWLSTLSDIKKYTPRIPGIDNHLSYIIDHLIGFLNASAVGLTWSSLSQIDLIKDRFLNA